MSVALAELLAVTPQDVAEGTMGVIAGTVGAAAVIIPKTVIDVVIGAFGDNKPASLFKAVLDGAAAAWVLNDVLTRKGMEGFWKGAETAFGFWEALYSGITIIDVIARYATGR